VLRRRGGVLIMERTRRRNMTRLRSFWDYGMKPRGEIFVHKILEAIKDLQPQLLAKAYNKDEGVCCSWLLCRAGTYY
jgi:hypothetical protein